jgi:sarcosine oxidase
VAVVGLGVAGSAAAWQLARRGLQVIAFEQHGPLHGYGSSHGRTRIIREAYFEHPLYVPLVRRAHGLWQELEAGAPGLLLAITGGLSIGPPGSAVFAGALRSVREHGLPHEVLESSELRARYPAFAPAEDMAAVLEPRAGLLRVEECLTALQAGAARAGAVLRHGETVLGWRPDGSGTAVRTTAGEYRAGHLVICTGPWLSRLATSLRLPLRVERQLSHWFEPLAGAAAFDAERCPVTIWEHEPGRAFYTIPDPGGQGFKAGLHHQGEPVDPDTVDRRPNADDEARVRALLARYVPAANGRLRDARVCLYTNTPDEHFLIDRHPQHPNVILASPCSGHGFKFGPAVGEVLADLVSDGRSRFDLAPFSLSRFDAASR